MPSIAEPSRADLDILVFATMADLDNAVAQYPELADLRVYSEARYLRDALVRHAYVTRLAFNNLVSSRHYDFWRTLDECQWDADLNGKIIVL